MLSIDVAGFTRTSPPSRSCRSPRSATESATTPPIDSPMRTGGAAALPAPEARASQPSTKSATNDSSVPQDERSSADICSTRIS